MHAYRAGQSGAQTRVLYFFRSPSNVVVGRKALDQEVLDALEHTHPDLTFDWRSMLRDPAMSVVVREPRRGRPERPERDRSRDRKDTKDAGQRSATPAPASVPQPIAVSLEDESLLGTTLGAREAARLRGVYQDVLQRIARRAPTPEERDRLTDLATRLNPDEWADEAAIRSAVSSIEADFDAITAELPRRRRGRRGGGRRREQANAGSAIIDSESQDTEEHAHEDTHSHPFAPIAPHGGGASVAGDGGIDLGAAGAGPAESTASEDHAAASAIRPDVPDSAGPDLSGDC